MFVFIIVYCQISHFNNLIIYIFSNKKFLKGQSKSIR